jgi:hypothetical protein
MDEELRGILFENTEKVCHALAQKGPFAISDAAGQVFQQLSRNDAPAWKRIQEHFALQGVITYVNKIIAQAKAADPARRKLPGLESMPLLVTSEGAAILSEQLIYNGYQTELKRLERKIESYKYKRRKPENLEQDLKRLTEMKTFDPRFAKYSKDKPDLTLAEAKVIEAEEVKPHKKRKRKNARR